jgi:hypothetical protein
MFFLSAVVLLTIAVSTAISQRPPAIPVQDDVSERMFKIRVVNGANIPVYYKLVGGRGRSFAHETLQPGESETDSAWGGEKVLCVWDLRGNVIGVGVVRVNRSGKVVIGGLPQLPEGARAAPALPSMPVVPEDW